MAENSSIEWTDTTWQVTTGCEEVSPGCGHCYARTMAKRLRAMALADIAAGKDPGAKRHYINAVDERGKWTGKVVPRPDALNEPLRWKKPRRVFVNSMSDLFHPDVPFAFIDQVFAVMALTPQHTYQVLTKRPERMAEYLTRSDAHNQIELGAEELGLGMGDPALGGKYRFRSLPFQNVWLGTSVENQETCSRLDYLTKCPAAVRFVSFEPLLERVIAHKYFALCKCGGYGGFHGFTACPNTGGVAQTCERTGCEKLRPLIHWAIVGGESGPSARDAHIGHGSSIVDQCRAAGIPVFRKQLGSVPLLDYYEHDDSLREWALSGVYEVWEPTSRGEWYLRTDNDRYQPPPGTVIRVKLKHRKGGDPAEWHESLRVREFPTEAAR